MTLALSGALIAFYPAFAAVTGARLGLRADWLWLLAGLFAQGGVAEETLFRGYLFRHFRVGRSFWKAAGLSLIPFVAVHLLLFTQLSWPLALASTLLAAAMSIPMARLFELGDGSVWAPGLLHFVVQGSIKLVVFPDALAMPAAVCRMALSAVLPWAVFLVRLPARPDCGGSVSH